MGKPQNDQKGFGVVETILVLVIVGLIGVVGFMVYNNHHKATTVAATDLSATKSAKTPNKTTAPAVQPITSYADCIKSKSTTTDIKNTYPPTCTTSEGVVYMPTDPSNFPQGQQQINIPDNPYVAVYDTGAQPKDGYCYTNEVPGPQATATLEKTAGMYALVRVSPNCGDSLQLTYSKTGDHWSKIYGSHLGLCSYKNPDADPNPTITNNPTLMDAVSKLCN
jgi:Tfp pilus assembly protein PilE